MRLNREYYLQKNFCYWLDAKHILYCASAGGMRTNIGTAIKMKKAGYKKGFPDLFIYMARGNYYGMALELKLGTKPSAEQLEWGDKLKREGYLWVVVPHKMNYTEALNWLKDMVEEYLKLERG